LLRKIGLFKILPIKLRKMEQMLPATGPLWPRPLPAQTAASERTREDPHRAGTKTIAFFPGCIGSVMFEDVNRKAVELLSACGANVTVSPSQVCCGAIHHHNGAHHQAQEFARRNIDAILPRRGLAPDFIATCIAGCGA